MSNANVTTNKAVEDILKNPRFEGGMETISWLTEFVDLYFVMFISIISFFIISGALLRNVIAGAYAAFPKFWDAISEAKEEIRAKADGTNNKGVSILFRITSWVFPDLKKLSDFHDNNIEPKDYFLKAIPQMVAVVMIGVVIYNGFYRDGVEMTSNFGSELIQRVFLNVDPVAVFDRVFQNATRPDFSTADDTSTTGKYAEKVSKKIYSDIVTYWTDVESKAAKSSLTQNIENWVLEQMSSNQDMWNENKYKISVQVDRVLGTPNLDRLSNGDTDIITTSAWSTPVTAFEFDSTQHLQEDWHVRFIARFEKIPEKASGSKTFSQLALEVPAASVTIGADNYVVNLGHTDKFGISGSKVTVNGKPATWNPNNGTLTIAKIDGFREGNITLSISGFTYKVADDNGSTRSHSIRQLKIGPTAKFTQGDTSFAVGEGPTFNPDSTKDKGKEEKPAGSN